MSLADAPDVLTVEEAADVLRCGRTAMYAAVRRGDVYSVRIGRNIRVPRHKLAELLGEEANDPANAGPSSTTDAASPRGRKEVPDGNRISAPSG